MKATDLLQEQHRLVEKLFARFERARGQRKVAVFDEIAHNLVAHDAIERELFYPACAEVLKKDDDVLPEAIVEHGVVEFCLYLADQHRRSSDFAVHVDVLREMVEHHVKEEEKDLIPRVRRSMDKAQNETLGRNMEQRFEALLQSDYRRDLKQALQRVLEGKHPRPSLAAKKKRARRPASRKSQRTSSVRRVAA